MDIYLHVIEAKTSTTISLFLIDPVALDKPLATFSDLNV